MAFSTPSFLSRLTRAFTSTTTLGISSADGSGAVAAQSIPAGAEKATIAAGCFWGVEHMYRKHFDGKGLYDARVGYIGGDSTNPSYRAVCSGTTGRTYIRYQHAMRSYIPPIYIPPCMHTYMNACIQPCPDLILPIRASILMMF